MASHRGGRAGFLELLGIAGRVMNLRAKRSAEGTRSRLPSIPRAICVSVPISR